MIKLLLSIYIFISINDLILYALNALQLKNLLLVSALGAALIGTGRWARQQAWVFYCLIPLIVLSIIVGFQSANDSGGVFQQALSLAVAILIPLMVERFAGYDLSKWEYVSKVLMISLVFMMIFKIIFVLYQMGFVANGLLDLLFKNIQGRGEIDGIVRMNTGTQLLMLYGLLFCVIKLLRVRGRQRAAYIFVAVLFALDLFIASSRFFTLIAPVAVVLTLYFSNIKVPKSVSIGIGFVAVVVAAFLLQDVYSGRIETADAGDGIRNEQISALFDSFLKAPLLGHGSGYSLPSLTRNDDVPFMYEVQVVAFLMQYGIIGSLLFGGAIFIIIKPHIGRGHIALAVFYCALFFAASYFNPYMLGTYAGLSVAMIVIILKQLSINRNGKIE